MSEDMWSEDKVYFFLRRLGFSHRETDIVKAMIESKTVEETAKLYNIAECTVNTHYRRIYAKSNTNCKSKLITYLNKKGLNKT